MAEATFTRTDEQRLLADSVRRLLADRAPSERIREVMLDDGVDDGLWKALGELGVPGLLVSEGDGGAGATHDEVAAVMEELGRGPAPVPMLSSAVLATSAITAGADAAQRQRWLPGLVAGAARATLAHLDATGSIDAPPGVRARAAGSGWRLTGEAGYVLDGAGADLLVLAAVDDGGNVECFVLDHGTPGLDVEPLEVLDLTRPMARVRVDAEVDDDARLGQADGAAVLHLALAAGIVALASEQLGGAREIHARTVEHAKQRLQFGRPIGSFQAVKHRLADGAVQLEATISAVRHAARALTVGEAEEAAIAAPMAKSLASETFERVAADAIQIHGGIGFTWEHDAHLFYKRAVASKQLLGDPVRHRRVLGDVLGL